jgi:hypothetical protein
VERGEVERGEGGEEGEKEGGGEEELSRENEDK